MSGSMFPQTVRRQMLSAASITTKRLLPSTTPFLRTLTSASTPPSSSPSSSPRRRSFFTSSLLLSAGIFTGFAASLFPRPKLLALIFPVPTPHSPGSDTHEGREWMAQVESNLQSLALIQKLRASSEYTESRPYANSSPGPHSLSAHTLRGPGKFSVSPIVFTSLDKKSAVFFMHLGGGLCGHEGVIHGGILATILDETLARTAFLGLPNQIGVTAKLSVAYKKPTFAEQFVVIRTELTEVKGRKAWSKGRIETLKGDVLVEGEALFVEPRLAQFLNKSTVKEAMG